MEEAESFKRRSASFGSSLSYRPPTPPTSYKNSRGSNLRRTERIHLVESSDSDTPTQKLCAKKHDMTGDVLSSSDSNDRHRSELILSGYHHLSSTCGPLLIAPCCKGTQVDDTVFLDANGFYERSCTVVDGGCTVWNRAHVKGESTKSHLDNVDVPSVDGPETSDTSLSIPFSSPVPSSSECHSSELHRLEGNCLVLRRAHRHTRDHKRSYYKRRPTVTQSLVLVQEPHHSTMHRVGGVSPSTSDCSCTRIRSDSNVVHMRKKNRNGYHVEVASPQFSDSSSSSAHTIGSHRRRVKSVRHDRNVVNSRERMLIPCADGEYGRHSRNMYLSSHRMASIPPDDANSFQKIQHLESEKKNLLLQVSVLQEQVDAQTEKVKELESIIEEKHRQSREIEKNLHQEMVTRSAVENTKLELLTEISSLRQKLTIAERERRESEERCRRIEGDLGSLYDRVGNTDAEQSVIRNRAGGNGMIASSSNKGHEIEKLRRTLESVMLSNEEKDQRIEDLRLTLIKYKTLQDAVYSSHQKKGSEVMKESSLNEIECLRDLKSSPSPRNEAVPQCQSLRTLGNKPSPGLPLIVSSPSCCEARYLNEKIVPSVQSCSHQSSCSVCPSVTVNKSNSLENIHQASMKASPSAKSAYGTMPRQNGPQALQELHEQLQHYENRPNEIKSSYVDSPPVPDRKSHEEINRGSRNKSSGVSFGKGFFKLRSGKRSSSAPELAPLESVTIPRVEREYVSASPTPQPTMQPFIIKSERDRSKGFRKFFTKWKRSGSQNIEKLEGDFRRGNIRATAGPRLGWSRDVSTDPDIPFPRWTTDYVVEWLHKIGLSMYISECKRWRCNGEVLLNATAQEIEKQLNLKNSMHKKKLLLAVQAMKSDNLPSSINQMDYLWVLRWLDDVGLPQYKDAFTEARVDGRVLHYLTVEDLLHLKVTNQLHHISIKRGIQVLREQNFNPHCLIRRSLPDEDKVYTPERVALWTNHRVMEWLRTVDLSEYAPNLRGSGVHGALIVYEPKFNTDLFATVLNIPPTKTLLRRHLATHFKTIIGADLAQIKRDLETDQLYTPLTPSIKIKGIRKPQFSLKKKKVKPDGDDDEFVCPMDIPVGSEPIKSDREKLVVRRNSDPVPQEKALDVEDEKAVEEIGAVSKEITSLTNMLQEEKLLKNAPTTNV